MKNTSIKKMLWTQRYLLLMTLPFLIHLIIFSYIPLYGWLMAFQDYKPGKLIIQSEDWVGFKHFIELFQSPDFGRILRNTVGMTSLSLIFGTLATVFLAICIHETKHGFGRRAVQTVSYLPHFISWVIAVNFVLAFLRIDGFLNNLLISLNIIDEPYLWMGNEKLFWWVIVFSGIWKGIGWGAIIYLAAMSAIDPQLYDAADVDGARRYHKIWYITLPGIRPTFMILFILNIGSLLNAGFEQPYLLQNGLVQEYAEVFDTYILRYGIGLGRYSYATAAGIFKSVVSIVLIVIANQTAKRLGEESIY